RRRRSIAATAAPPRATCPARPTRLGVTNRRTHRGDPLWMNRPTVFVPALDRVLRHLVHVEEEVFLPLRGQVEDCPVVRHLVFDRGAELEDARRDRIRNIAP